MSGDFVFSARVMGEAAGNTVKASDAGYIRQLDGVRAIAVVLVLWTHFIPNYQFGVKWGAVGVLTFFALSGFLITGILLRCRSFTGETQSLWITARQFYLRRMVRIFPLFYGWIALMWLLNVPPMRDTVWWHVSYLSNIYFAQRGAYHGSVSPFWSLAVEEQFYLLWPWVILVLPRRALLPAIVGLIVVAPLTRLAIMLNVKPNDAAVVASEVLMPCALDALGLGSLLAYLSWEKPLHDPGIRKLAWASLIVGGAGMVIVKLLAFNGLPMLKPVLMPLCIALFFTAIIHATAVGVPGVLGKSLTFAPLTYIGKVSYGIYVIHNFVPHLTQMTKDRGMFDIHAMVWSVTSKLGLSEQVVNIAVFPLLWSAIAIALAALSWHLYEKPLNDFKRFWPYDLRKKRKAATVADAQASA
jgi:peptidoglycan/LPS O-acetylase OafA/YrhL